MRVLIVDDDIATVNVIEQKVDWQKLGITEVFTAYNIARAREIIGQRDVDIIISDIEMPQGTGIDLLSWYRKNNYEGEFLLLTCHESFDYASHAIKLQASEYLLKPFDVVVMEAALLKLITKSAQKAKENETLEYGKWAAGNRHHLQANYIRTVLEGRADYRPDPDILDLNLDKKYRLIISRVTEVDKASDRISPGLLGFILENIHSEILTGSPENSRVVTMEQRDSCVLVSVCDCDSEKNLEDKVKEIIYQIGELARIPVSCCISSEVKVEQFHDKFEECLRLLTESVAYYKNVFFEEKVERITDDINQVLDVDRLISIFEEGNKTGFLEYLKKVLNTKVFSRQLNDATLKVAQRDVWHAVYSFFAKKQIDASEFFQDENSRFMSVKANQSVMDMMKWANTLSDQLFSFVEEHNSGQSPVDKIKAYVREHYMENIGRSEIADELGLNAEYVSKLFKKETGTNLSDYIAGYRIEQAKNLLEKGNLTISEVSEACGFENQTYFSTIFKKYVGITPNQYRRG